MKKKILSMAMALSMGLTGIVPVMAADEIIVPGEVIYEQNFEGTVEDAFTTKIGANSAFALSVETEDDGNKALKIMGTGAYGLLNFGPEYTDAIITADVKQTAASGNSVAYFGIGARTLYKSSAYHSNIATFFDIHKDASGTTHRDKLAIATGSSAMGTAFTSVDALSANATGALITSGRKFSDYYTMTATIAGSKMYNSISDANGNVLDSISATITPTTDGAGTTTLRAHGPTVFVDNIEIREIANISSFTAATASDSVLVDNSTDIVLKSGNIELSPAAARYEYDTTALSINAKNGTVTPLKGGTHTVKVYLDDMMSDASLSASFTVNAVDVLKITIPAKTLYTQDFEGTVEEAMTTAIGTSGSFGLEVVTEDDGNKALQITGTSALGLNNFGPEYTDAVITADVKQTTANGNGAAYFGIGTRTYFKSNSYNSNIAAYFDIYKHVSETDYTYGSAVTSRDRLAIATGASANASKLTISAMTADETGALITNGRKFSDYYTMTAAIAGSTMYNSISDANGNVLDSISATITPTTDGAGTTTLRAHSGNYLVDNIEIREIAKIAEFTASADKAEEIGTAVDFALASGALDIDTAIARYVYDDSALTVDAEKGTVTPLKAGDHTVTVYLDDLFSTNSLSTTFTVSVEEAPVVPAEPTVTLDKDIRWESTLENMVASAEDNTLTVDGEVVYGVKVTLNANNVATYTKADVAAGENAAEVVLPSQVSGASDVVFYIISNADIDSVTLK